MLTTAKNRLGPQDQGRTMSLRAFDVASADDGYLFELAKGVVVVSEVRHYDHPDLALYLHASRDRKGRNIWHTGIPELVIEVVSLSSVDRYNVEKREVCPGHQRILGR